MAEEAAGAALPEVRPERPGDRQAIRAIHAAAFPTAAEADLVDALRAQAAPRVSLVAEEDGVPLGHILFSPVTVEGDPEARVMGLAPVAVLPAHQQRGIGSLLVGRGLDACASLGIAGVVVLGHPAFYSRFGFTAASRAGLRTCYDVPDDVFMALELVAGRLRYAGAPVRYHSAFDALG